MTVSYMKLIRVQQKRHDLPTHDRHFRSAADVLAAGRAARERLMGSVVRPRPVSPSVELAKALPVAEVPRQEPEDPATVPLNMLAPCSARFMLRLVALRHGLKVSDILGGSRLRPHVAARAEAMSVIYQHTQWSLPQVGRFFKRDHTTVLHALNKMGVVRKKVEVETHLASIHRPGRKGRDIIILGSTPGFSGTPALAAEEIIAQVCEKHGISELELRSARRANRMVFARHEAMYRLAKELALSNPQIGLALGGKDPSMVSVCIRAHEARLNAEAGL